MKKKENQRIALTKRLLRESLLRLMSDKGIQSITVTELCEDAGINRSTFYNHFGSPADVLTDIEEGVFADLEYIWENNSGGKSIPVNKRVEALCLYLQEHRALAKLLFRNSDTNSGFAAKIINASNVRLAYEQDLSYIQSQDKLQLAITFLTNGIYYAIRQWLLDDIPIAPKEMGELACLLVTKGWYQSVIVPAEKPKTARDGIVVP
ncbi:MAG: TetR/AcrR family transcriptional regulator [Candidatus Faecivicinus sp.]